MQENNTGEVAEILKPRRLKGTVVAWASRHIIEQHLTLQNADDTLSLFRGIPDVEIKLDARSGITFTAPAHGHPNAVTNAFIEAFAALQLPTKISKCAVMH